VREIGCSNFGVKKIEEAERTSRVNGWARFVSAQNEYSLLRRLPEQGVLDACAKYDMAFIPYFPLANGMLTGKYKRNAAPPEGTRLARMPEERRADALSDENFDRIEALEQWARGRGHTVLELAFAWLLARPEVASVIAGATKPQQIAENAAAADWTLTADDVKAIDDVMARTKAR
jgi:aryl-alcohol dehydrogenase-like predicted oxidoreductase